ncbi:MAG: T9SS type A sorting domain-containing protein [Bacteroidetes bacterium]|nr:T9SS type A sorting domain-containing protein [Bacteroidota bacterium]
MRLTFTVFVLLLLTRLTINAAPGNDNFGSAQVLTHGALSCSANGAYTTVAATNDKTPGSCWNTTGGSNVWFKFTASTTQVHFDVLTGGASGTLQYAYAALWNNTGTVQLACNQYFSQYSGVSLDYASLTIGQDYYISVDNHNGSSGYRGTFAVCLGNAADYDLYEGARDVTSLINTAGSSNGAYTNALATSDKSPGSCWNTTGGHNVWFKFQATATGNITVNLLSDGTTTGTMQYAYAAVWDTNGTSQLSCAQYTSNYSGLTITAASLTPGNWYYISVDTHNGSSGYRGSFKLTLSDVDAYDFYQGAKDVTSLINSCSSNAAYTTAFASADQTKGSCWANGPNNNVWFKFTATATTAITVQVKDGGAFGTILNPFVAIWTSGLVQVGCQNYVGGGGSIQTSVIGLTPGSVYYISVDNYSGYKGSFTLCLSDAVSDDFYQGATDVTSLINTCSANAAYTTQFYTADQAKGSCWANGPNNNRWFKFTATATTAMTVQVKDGGAFGTILNPFVAIWTSGLVPVGCQNYIGGGGSIQTSVMGLTPGATYYISVDNYSGYQGSFTLCLSDVVSDDFYQGATDVTSLINTCSANAAYTTQFYTPDQAKGSCWSNGPNNNRWFKFTATATTAMTVQVKDGGAFGTILNPFVAIWTSGLVQVGCQNYLGGGGSIQTSVMGLTPGATYYISVDNYVGYQGSFTLCLSDVVSDDFYQGATDVTSLINTCSANAAFSTQFATPDQSKGSCWSNGPNNNRWYKFTASKAFIHVDVNVGGSQGTMLNPFVAIWNGSLTQLACQNYIGGGGSISIDYYGLTPGSVYYISVDNYSGYQGSFTLCLNDAGDYDYFEGATLIGDLDHFCSANAAYTTVGASPDRSKPACWSNGPNTNRWFKFVAVFDTVTISLKYGGVYGTLQNPFMALWNSTPSVLVCKNYAGASSPYTMTYNNLTVGQTYYISIDNYAGYQGSFSLCVNNVSNIEYYAIASGEWTDHNTWSRSAGGSAAATAPTISNKVHINGYDVSLAAGTGNCFSVDLNTNSGNSSLTVNGQTLNVGDKITATNTGFTSYLQVINNGIVNCTYDASFVRTSGSQPFQLLVDNGTFSVGNDFYFDSNGGTVNTNLLTVNNSSAINVTRDFYLRNTTGSGIQTLATLNNSAVLSVGRDINFNSSASGADFAELILNGGSTLKIARNLQSDANKFGRVTSNGSSIIEFNGSSNTQVIPATTRNGGDTFSFLNVKINNTNPNVGGVQLTTAGPAAINGALTLTSGIVQTASAAKLILNSSATTGLGSSSSYISGPMDVVVAAASATVNFPIGKLPSYRPVYLHVDHTDLTSVTYTAELFNSSAGALGYTLPATVNRVSGVHYWQIDRSANANLTGATATLYYGTSGTDDQVTDYTNLTMVKNVGAGTTWVDITGTATANGNGSITSGNFNSFSTFTIANLLAGTNPLPVSLTSFTGEYIAPAVNLTWKTASELNNSYFQIRRSSNGEKFDVLGTVKGSGTKATESVYKWIDENPLNGLNYYQLVQFDLDGKSSTNSQVIAVDVNKEYAPSIQVFPNPSSATQGLNAQLSGVLANHAYEAEVLSLFGQTMQRYSITTGSSGLCQFPLNNLTLPPGLYLIRVPGTNLVSRFVIK